MRKKATWILVIIAVAAAVIVSLLADVGDGVPYSSFTVSERGASLIYDTLRHMGYPVRQSRRPISRNTSTNDVYIVIQPRRPSRESAEEMLEWVYAGGRLFFLCRSHPNTIIERILNAEGRSSGGFTIFTHGQGEVITGRASAVTNDYLMNNPSAGQTIHALLYSRDFDTIFFAEYYHGFQTAENLIGRLPLVVRLVFAQMLIVAVIALWHLGKRFGNPVPYYQEVEREENEYVRALARLYMESDRKK